MIKVFIKDQPKDLMGSFGEVITVSELDDISFEINLGDEKPEVYIEDYKVIMDKKGNSFLSKKHKFFRESFGLSYLRVYHRDNEYEYVFNVLAEKVTSDQALSIIEYVYSKNPNLLKVNLSRTTVEKNLVKDEQINFESLLDFTQSLINFLDTKKPYLKKLIKKKSSINKGLYVNSNNKLIDPEDVLFNLDKIYQDSTSSDIYINRNYYSASNLPSNCLVESFDFKENQIILSGLICSQINLKNILDILNNIDLHNIKNSDKEYNEFTYKKHKLDIAQVILKVTSVGLIKRIFLILREIEYYIDFFRNILKVSYHGPIYPTITKLVISNPFYKEIFHKIKYIYECGSFGANGISAKIKIRSMSKIYEFFCLYKMIDGFKNIGFITKDEIHENEIMKAISLESDNKYITIYYEKIIHYIGNLNPSSSDLFSVNYDHERKKYKYYNPDFVLKIKDKKTSCINYYILDAKFRNSRNLRNDNVLAEIKTKYFDNIRYFNSENNTLSNSNILGNIILYQGKEDFRLYENVHLSRFISLPIFEARSLYDEIDINFLKDILNYTDIN